MLVLTLCACTDSLKKIYFKETNITMTVGDVKALEVYTEPQDAALTKLDWSSTNSTIVRVEDGTVRALATGSAVVSVTTGKGMVANCNITVVDKEITNISLSETTATVKVGSSIKIKATVSPADAPDTGIKWSSSDTTVATVNSEGQVTGVGAGVANIICAASNDVEVSCTVTVKGSSNTSNSTGYYTDSNYYTYGHFNPNYVYVASDFVFPDSSMRELTRGEIAEKLSYMSGYSPSGSYALDAINEIYARNGYVFKSDTLMAYYQSKLWYYPDSSFTTADFSSIEKHNLSLLEEFD